MHHRPAAVGLASAALAGLTAVAAWAAGTSPQTTWNFDQARVPAARGAGQSGAGVVVAVLDTWVDAAHKDFEGRVLAGADCMGGSCRPGAASPDQCDHGTHVAGTIGSSSFGVAPQVTLLPVRVLTYDSSSATCVGRSDDVANGIRWAVSQGAKVLNLSLGADLPGLSRSSAIPDAVAAAAQAGAVVVFSAGNADAPVADSYNGNALIVAATGPDGQLASYSQHGAGVSLAAPGGDPRTPKVCHQDDCITSLYPGNRYAVAAGTSMAAPHVSGVAALLFAQDPHRTRQQVMDRLTATARPLAQAGSGLLDASAALGVRSAPAASHPPAPPVPVVQGGGPSAPAAPATRQAASPPPLRPHPTGTPRPQPSAVAAGGAAAALPTTTGPASSSPAVAATSAPPPDARVPRAAAPVGGRLPAAPVAAALALATLPAIGLILLPPRRMRRRQL